MLIARWRERGDQARPIHLDRVHTARGCGDNAQAQEWGCNVKCKNTRLSAAVSSTCWLPLTLKSSCTDSLTHGELSRTLVFHSVGCLACASRHQIQGVYTRTG